MKEQIKLKKKQITLFQSLIPMIVLIALLGTNVFVYGSSALDGSNQFVLLIGGLIAIGIGLYNRVKYEQIIKKITKNVRETTRAIYILLLVGALSGTWLLSGIIPTMIYYGLQILEPQIFLPATIIICSIIALATGSSWTTSATVGIALVGIGNAMGISMGLIGGAVISGAYFGDKLSPLSDTTNLASAMTNTDLFTHIRYMLFTTVPSYIITLIIFIIISFNLDVPDNIDMTDSLIAIENTFNITPWLFLVPVIVIVAILKKVKPILALLLGTLLGAIFALFFQPDIVTLVGEGTTLNAKTAYKGIMNAITTDIAILSPMDSLNSLFEAGGMASMLNTVWLIICAMFFGGAMEAIGALKKITESLLSIANSVFGLFASTMTSCVVVNLTASEQYLSIVIPGKMFANAYKEKGLASENLSRTLEDSGTVTSVLIPWNTCGAYHAGVLGIDTFTYAPYAFFNIISPFVSLTYVILDIKIRKIANAIKA
ncbi:Na+/H+ antiporter NhaC [Myroides pelagicus]|uniref:Na+/H+ antiporter NhaC n=1 Tax=Myroides pelagicus TaxID=270914 RepID=A0A7K1GP47_9FLAO|nr:Na+/H+ antiporter NhaC [Myroides pelagicus]MEC4113610.1 Na+/H+ antiporter NhaC [Myroides pelagicus]MTH30616.1 Na+/H+ antiporter NhaC [Myroides pelagicus]